MHKSPAIGQIENGGTHHAIESVGDAADAGLELFPKQIAARVARRGLGFLLAESIRCEHDGNSQCSEPHVPIFAAEKFKGKSGAGLYGDVMQELDWSVGEVLGTLRRLNLEERTLVIFISDNGPFLSYGEHSGSATPLREGKLTAFEGGVRVPGIMRWPDGIPSGNVTPFELSLVGVSRCETIVRRCIGMREQSG